MVSVKKIVIMLWVFVTIACGFAYINPNNMTVSAWTPAFKGVWHATGQGTTDDGRIQKVNVIKIDLYDPDIELLTTASNGPLPMDTTRQKAADFIISTGVQIAINGVLPVNFDSSYADLGLSISQGNIVSPAQDLHGQPPYVNPATLLVTQNNTAQIVFNTTPATNLTGIWTAVESWGYDLRSGANYGDPRIDPLSTFVNPRSAVALSQEGRYLFLMTIDGRQPGYSDGANEYEEAQWQLRFGAYNGFNLDGGGSTHLWVSEHHRAPYALNRPSEDRAVCNHLGIYAAPLNAAAVDYFIYADFEEGREYNFTSSLTASGSTYGISASSTADAVTEQHYLGSYSQKLNIVDSSQSGGWFVRHLSGSSATRSQNVLRPTTGYVGLWAKTASAGCQLSIAIDDTNNTTADRGDFKTMIADNQWHLYEWDLEADGDWHGWVNGDGIINTADFTIDSIQIQSASDINAVIYLDEILHNPRGSLIYTYSAVGDFEPDGDIDLCDFAALAESWLRSESDPAWNRIFDMDAARDGEINLADLIRFAEDWLYQ